MAFHCILACESQLRAIPMGLNNLNLSSAVTDTVKDGAGEVKWAVGELEWSTLMIVLDRAVGFVSPRSFDSNFLFVF